MILKDILVGFPEEFLQQRKLTFRKLMMLNRGGDPEENPKDFWKHLFILLFLIGLVILIIEF